MMTTEATKTTAGSSPVERQVRPYIAPTRAKVEALMKRCQIGVGGRHALDNAHDIMAECYGTLGLLMLCLEQQQAECAALRQMYEEADAESDALRGA